MKIVHQTKILEFCGLKCRIEIGQSGGLFFQRHTWYPSKAAPWRTEIYPEAWIMLCPDAQARTKKENQK